MVDLLLEAEGEVVVLAPRRDLFAHAHEDRAVPALLAAPARFQGVVVREQDDVGARPRRRGGDLGDRARAVGIRRVAVDDAGEVGHAPDAIR